MRQRKSKKILIYFLLLLLLGTINNIGINKIQFVKISNIQILGLGEENNKILSKKIKSLNLKNILFIKKKKIQEIIESNSLVEKYDIFKTYPSSLYINIQKTKFLARIKNDGQIFLVGSNGKFSHTSFYDEHLPFIFGNPKIKDFLEFKKIIDKSKISYNEIKNLYYFPSNRWDVELKNNILIKLPEKRLDKSLELISKFLNNKEYKDIKLVDLRINNQMIINE